MKSYSVFRIDHHRTRMGKLATVTLDEQDHITVAQIDPAADDDGQRALESAVAELNEATSLACKEPPTADDPPRSIRKVSYDRGSAGFFAALQDNLQRWHLLELEEVPGSA